MGSIAYELGREVAAQEKTAKVHVGKDSPHTREELEGLMQQFATNTGANLSKATVLANTSQFGRNLVRQFVPQTLPQVPGRALRAAGVALTPLVPRIGLETIVNTINNAAVGKGDYYSPSTSTVNVNQSHPDTFVGTFAHEMGHWADKERNQSHYPRQGFLRRRGNEPLLPGPQLQDELAASMFARRAVGETEWQKHREELEPALGTYVAANSRDLGTRSLGEWWQGAPKYEADPKWKKNLPTQLQSGDHATRQRAIRQALLHAGSQAKNFLVMETDGRLSWTPEGKKHFAPIIRQLFDAEHKRLHPQPATTPVKD